jgi:hypothetical protein
MEEIRILVIGFCIYGIVYCVYAIKVVLVHREVQSIRFKQTESDADQLNKLYLLLVSKCEETPKDNITINEISKDLRRLKRKSISFC